MSTSVARFGWGPFLAAVEAYPNDDGPKLVFLDHLEEQGDPLASTVRWCLGHGRWPFKLNPWDDESAGVIYRWWSGYCNPPYNDCGDLKKKVFDKLATGRMDCGGGRRCYPSAQEALEDLHQALARAKS